MFMSAVSFKIGYHVMTKPVLPYAKNKGADQAAHPRSLISKDRLSHDMALLANIKLPSFGRLFSRPYLCFILMLHLFL